MARIQREGGTGRGCHVLLDILLNPGDHESDLDHFMNVTCSVFPSAGAQRDEVAFQNVALVSSVSNVTWAWIYLVLLMPGQQSTQYPEGTVSVVTVTRKAIGTPGLLTFDIANTTTLTWTRLTVETCAIELKVILIWNKSRGEERTLRMEACLKTIKGRERKLRIPGICKKKGEVTVSVLSRSQTLRLLQNLPMPSISINLMEHSLPQQPTCHCLLSLHEIRAPQKSMCEIFVSTYKKSKGLCWW
ncbi:hypothetical protein H671_4g11563 [Cricetulus griseus]|nr:hypothetical protein H671_4g11563 [Cricetulus griseus]